MKSILSLLLLTLLFTPASAAGLKISSLGPFTMTSPSEWEIGPIKAPHEGFPFETYRVRPADGRNAVLLISVLDRNRKEFLDEAILRRILLGDCRPYVNLPDELSKIEIKRFSSKKSAGFYANFIDPDLVGKPIRLGSYKTATPVIFHIGSDYLLKATILCDDLNSPDYAESLEIIKSIIPQK